MCELTVHTLLTGQKVIEARPLIMRRDHNPEQSGAWTISEFAASPGQRIIRYLFFLNEAKATCGEHYWSLALLWSMLPASQQPNCFVGAHEPSAVGILNLNKTLNIKNLSRQTRFFN